MCCRGQLVVTPVPTDGNKEPAEILVLKRAICDITLRVLFLHLVLIWKKETLLYIAKKIYPRRGQEKLPGSCPCSDYLRLWERVMD